MLITHHTLLCLCAEISFTERLRRRGLSVVSTNTDGNCLFHALRSQMNIWPSSDISAAKIRNDIVNFIRNCIFDEKSDSAFRSRLVEDILTRAESVEKYIADMSTDGFWGDGAIIAAASELYQRQIIVYSDSSNEPSHLSETFGNNEPIQLGYVGGNHYVGILPLQTSASTVGPPNLNAELPEQCHDESEANSSVTSSHKCDQKLNVTNISGDRSKILDKRQQEYPWLTATDSGGALCRICSVYYANRPLPKGNKGTFITTPFANWKRSTGTLPKDNKLLKHELSNCHKTAASTFTECEKMIRQKKYVYSLDGSKQ